jgi:hypothetical protein
MLLLLPLLGCGPTADELAARERCYEQAESDAQVRVDAECPESFAACPVADDIMGDLRAAQEACP